jgi:hypothetical protein
MNKVLTKIQFFKNIPFYLYMYIHLKKIRKSLLKFITFLFY